MTETLSNDKKKRSFRGVSAEQRQAERQQKLLEAGLQCFGTHGFYKVTVREICAEAKLTERYFYESFKNTESLLVAVYQRLIHDMQNVMIMNPNSGPGDKIDQNYVKAVDKAQQAGIKILGYVATTYGNKRLEESTTQISNQQASVFKEINQYYNWYGVDGIFLDESASGPEKLDYYKQISEHIKSKGGQKSFTVLNPGVYPDEGYTKYSDVILTFEGTYQSYQTLPIPS
jgi:hypothetical protein